MSRHVGVLTSCPLRCEHVHGVGELLQSERRYALALWVVSYDIMIFLYSSHSGEISKITAVVHIRASMKINIKQNLILNIQEENKVKCRVGQDHNT